MEFTGRTVEEAKAKGLESLGISENQAEITVVAEAVKGLFGKVKKEAVVDVKKKEETAQPAKKTVKEEKAEKDNGVKAAAEFIGKLFEIMDVNAKANITD